MSGQQLQIAWLVLDDGDNQLEQFLAYLIASLETVYPGIGAEAWALLRAQTLHPPTHTIITSLINALAAAPARIVLALDDYHTITLQAIHAALAFLLECMPAHMHILMTTRADPLLPLARLRARQQLTELRATDLRFSADETVLFFEQVHGVALPAAAVATLESRTEGWVAGLHLAALSLRHQSAADLPAFLADFTGSHRYVFDYLMDEVFEQQPEHVRAFLVRTALLERFCAPLCDAVIGGDTAQTMLNELDQSNLFLIQLDSTRSWYRYHHLFRDFLCKRLELASEPADRTQLHLRASAWFKQNGLIREAIAHALHAEAWLEAIQCIAPLTEADQFYDYYLDLPGWLAALPEAALQADPEFCFHFGMALMYTGYAEAADRLLGLVETIWQTAGDTTKAGEMLCWRGMGLCFMGDFARAIMLAEHALGMLPPEATEQHGFANGVLGYSALSLGHAGVASTILAAAQRDTQHRQEPAIVESIILCVARVAQLRGKLHHAAAVCQKKIRRTAGLTHLQSPAIYFCLGEVQYEWNDLAAAERTIQEGISVGELTGRGRYWPAALGLLAQVLWLRRDVPQATSMIERALAEAHLLGHPRALAEAQAYQAWLWLAQGDLAAAAGWLATRALDDETPRYERQAEYLMLARIRLAQARAEPDSVDLNSVIQLLDQLRQTAEADERGADQISILVLTALAHAANNAPQHALTVLATALTLAEPEGYIRTFVDEGAPMQSLLLDQRAQIAADESHAPLARYVDRLLKAFPQPVPTDSEQPNDADILSERERDVLLLLAEGRTIQAVADHLIISAHTVRTHVKNIYAKLEVHTRVQALERARALQLL